MRIHLLGATGSIGLQTLEIVRKDPTHFQIVTMTCYKNIDKLSVLIDEFHPLYVSVYTKQDSQSLQQRYPDLEIGYGEEGLIRAATYGENAMVVNAVVGSAGLAPTVAAIKKGFDIALANKETLVIGGEIITPLLKKYDVTLLPIDSEHSAIFQCLQGEDKEKIKRLIITASGGSFRNYKRTELKNVSIDDALAHPNWSMGSKITIDSATMMNKGFEIIEAHYLFHVPYEQIEPLLHRESIIHSMVEFVDTSVIAQLGLPDMKIPIAYALYYPERLPFEGKSLNLAKVGNLHFEDLDFERYPLIHLAIEAGKAKGLMPATLNAANETAVALFLDGKIAFLDIERLIVEALEHFPQDKDITLDKILNRDKIVKEYLLDRYN